MELVKEDKEKRLEDFKRNEEKRLEDFKRIAENWDYIPEYAQGKMDGMISAVASMCEINKKG